MAEHVVDLEPELRGLDDGGNNRKGRALRERRDLLHGCDGDSQHPLRRQSVGNDLRKVGLYRRLGQHLLEVFDVLRNREFLSHGPPPQTNSRFMPSGTANSLKHVRQTRRGFVPSS